ncbi:hypothetical protein ACXR2T_08180 [Leucobacter sp. HY1910]
MIRKVITAAAAVLAVAALAGCSGPKAVTMPATELSSEIKVSKISGQSPDFTSLALMCIEEHAFVYGYVSKPSAGGPALSRFPEWDAKC